MRVSPLVIVAVLVAVGCTAPPQTTVAGPDWTVSLVTLPEAAALRPVMLRLTIKDRENALMTMDELTAVVVMPEMSHQRAAVGFRTISPGRYQATTTFPMDGDWEIVLEARRSGRTFNARLPLQVGK